ncbi:MAG: hypothetical protein ABIG37_01365 [Nanoarchaeota archaeon]
MTNFICLDCKYRFEADKKKTCPYCSSPKIEEEKSAEELIDSL